MRRAALCVLTFLALAPAAGAAPPKGGAAKGPAADSPLVRALAAELDRSVAAFKTQDPPLYFLGYEVYETRELQIYASYGAIYSVDDDRMRYLDVDARVGAPELDSTHPLREWDQYRWRGRAGSKGLPLGDDADALRAEVWSATEAAFRQAQQRFIQVKTNKDVKVEETDPSPDFSPWKAESFREETPPPDLDVEAWKGILKRVSAVFKEYPHVLDSGVTLSAEAVGRTLVNSEGSRVVAGSRLFRVTLTAGAKAEDAMELSRYRSFEAPEAAGLPAEEKVAAAAREMAAELKALREAPLVEPYTGPAILRGRAAAVFFHEVFGHREEGHRQKAEDEGQTFARKVGTAILPEFISVYDDPTVSRHGDTWLAGAYRFDDEGVPAQRASLVENGVLKGFLMSRSPIRGFPVSNGHGRRSPGNDAVARQGNLFIVSGKQVPYERLRELLLEECRRQGKPHGLVFEDIAGGFTGTQRWSPQAFKVIPLLVRRVYVDGRPDEIVRGVDIVGTPLSSLEGILATGDDPAVFNGTCGAESGWVPVSAVSPSLLVGTMEVEKKVKEQDRPPLLPPPLFDPKGGEAGAPKGGAQ